MTIGERSRALRYKRPALESLSWDSIMGELEQISEACSDVRYFIDRDGESLLNALLGDEEEEYEFRMMFSDLSGKADALGEAMYEFESQEDFDDCTVALIGNRYKLVGFDEYEEDYFGLCGYERDLAVTEAGKRLLRRTKPEMLAAIGQSVGTLLAFLDLREKYDYLKATMDVLRDGNTSVLRTLKAIDEVYDRAEAVGFASWEDATRELDRLIETLPERVWVEG